MTENMKSMLLERVKANLMVDHQEDDQLLCDMVASAVTYAEQYQNRTPGSYTVLCEQATGEENPTSVMSLTTERAVIILASHLYESRDGSTGGFFADNVQAEEQCWKTVNRLLALEKDWRV